MYALGLGLGQFGDGLLISWGNFDDGLTRLVAGALLLLEVGGLRKPFNPSC